MCSVIVPNGLILNFVTCLTSVSNVELISLDPDKEQD
jgi:hypothetical protein